MNNKPDTETPTLAAAIAEIEKETHQHSWIVRSFGGVGYIKEKVCYTCGTVAKRVPPVFDGETLITPATFQYIAAEVRS